jgi:transposase-like protein
MGAIATELVDSGETRDRRGRRITKAQRRVELVAEFSSSGLTMAAFARREGLNYATFAGWVAAQRAEPAKSPIKFTEVKLPLLPPADDAPLEVRLPDGTMVRGGKVGDLVTLLKALRS